MPKYALFLALPLFAAGCIGGRPQTGPGKVPKDVDSAGYSARPAAEVAACIGVATRSAVVQDGASARITLPTVSYSVESTSDAGVYPTQVFVRGEADDEATVYSVANCMAGSASN